MKRCVIFCAMFLLVSSWTLLHAQNDVNVKLIARNSGVKYLATLDSIRVFGFALKLSEQPGIPGPTIEANEGDSVHIDLWNVSQGAPHTIHLHGLDVDQQNDGVPHLSFTVGHMEHGFYHFKAPHAGTYLYHCHVASTIHVQAGMYGLIIIRPSDGKNTTWNGGYSYDREYSYFLSEVDTFWHKDSVLLHDHDTSMQITSVHIPVYDPQYFLINGFSDIQLEDENIEFNSAVNEIDYVRLANIGYYGVRVVFPEELNAKIIASDGRPLPVEEVSDTVYIMPGERYGVLTNASAEIQSQISFEYFDLNTMVYKNTQVVEVDVSGFAKVNLDSPKPVTFDVAPNPFDKQLSIHFAVDKNSEVIFKIFDVRGRLVYASTQETYRAGKNHIRVDPFINSPGEYLIQLMIDSKPVGTQKVIKL